MNEYLLSIIGTVLLCAFLTAIIPQGKTAAVIKGVTRLACVLVIISPVLRFFTTGELYSDSDVFNENFQQSSIQADASFIKYYSEMRIRQTEASLEEEIERRFELSTEVTLDWVMEESGYQEWYTFDKIKIKKIKVECKKEASKELRTEMWEYLTNNYCSEVLIE